MVRMNYVILPNQLNFIVDAHDFGNHIKIRCVYTSLWEFLESCLLRPILVLYIWCNIHVNLGLNILVVQFFVKICVIHETLDKLRFHHNYFNLLRNLSEFSLTSFLHPTLLSLSFGHRSPNRVSFSIYVPIISNKYDAIFMGK